MKTLLTLSLLTGLLFAPIGWAKQTKKPDIRLTATLDTAAPERQPILDIHIVNESGHTLRIPDPPLLCKPAPGALSLQVRYAPENGNQAQPPATCDLEVDGSGLADIRERAKNWVTLKPGQDYEARRPLAMGLDANAHGTYELWVMYDGPCANDDDAQKLNDAGIATVTGRFQSDKLTYKITSPRD
jgi:hypothetical protein